MIGLATLVATLLRFCARAGVVLACLASVLCAASIASANSSGETKTRVRDFSFAPALNTCPNAAASQRTHLENRNSSAKFASASSHAARAAPRYIAPAAGAAHKLAMFRGAWIERELFKDLQRLAGKSAFEKFKAALTKGVVGPTGESGIKILREPVRGFTHELKIGGSAHRLLGRIDQNDVLVFAEFVAGGLH